MLATLVAGVLGCGARSGVELAPDRGSRDAGSRLDAGSDAGSPLVRDGGRDAPLAADAARVDDAPDAPPACAWRELGAPLDVLREPEGLFEGPEVVPLGSDGEVVLLATHASPAGARTIRARRLSPTDGLGPEVSLELPPGVSGPAAAAPSAGMLGVVFPTSGGDAVLARYTFPALEATSQQRLGRFDVCSDAAGTNDRFLVALARTDAFGIRSPFVAHFASGGGFPPRPALSDGAGGVVATSALGAGLAWAGDAGRFAALEATLFAGAEPAPPVTVAGYVRGGVPPALGPWPFVPAALAIVSSTLGLRLYAIDEVGRELVRNEALGFQMFATPVPALAATDAGLLLAQLDFGDLDPRSGVVALWSIEPDGSAHPVGHGPYGVSRASEGGGADIAAAATGDRAVVHWTWSARGAGIVEETRTHAIVLACE